MQALIAFIVLSMLSAALFIAGAYALGGLGPALLMAGGCSLAGALFMRKGIAVG